MWYLDKEKNCWTNGTLTLPAGSTPPQSQMKKEEKVSTQSKDLGSVWSYSSSSSKDSQKKTSGVKSSKATNSESNIHKVGKAKLW
jgi:hypothetical protein